MPLSVLNWAAQNWKYSKRGLTSAEKGQLRSNAKHLLHPEMRHNGFGEHQALEIKQQVRARPRIRSALESRVHSTAATVTVHKFRPSMSPILLHLIKTNKKPSLQFLL